MRAVFASYSRADQVELRKLVEDVQKLGYDVWFDQQLAGGEQWWNEILRRVRSCDVFLFAISNQSLNSKACRLEHEYAVALRKPILPILVAPQVSKNLLPLSLASLQILDFDPEGYGRALSLGRALIHMPPCPPLPDPLPPAPDVPISYLVDIQGRVEHQGELDFEDQSSLLLRIKAAMRDPATAVDGKVLLQQFRRRRDLLAEIAAEVDDMTRISSPAPPTEPLDPTLRLSEQPSDRTQGRLRAFLTSRRAFGVAIVFACVILGAASTSRWAQGSATSIENVQESPVKVQPIPPAKHEPDPSPREANNRVVGSEVVTAAPPPAAASNQKPSSSVTQPGPEVTRPATEPPVPAAKKTGERQRRVPAKPRPKPPTPTPAPLSEHLQALQGTWMLEWRDPGASYQGMLEVRRKGGTLKVSYRDPSDGQEKYVTQTIAVEEREDEFVVQGKDVRGLHASAPIADGYAADHVHIKLPISAARIKGAFCDSKHTCVEGSIVRAH